MPLFQTDSRAPRVLHEPPESWRVFQGAGPLLSGRQSSAQWMNANFGGRIEFPTISIGPVDHFDRTGRPSLSHVNRRPCHRAPPSSPVIDPPREEARPVPLPVRVDQDLLRRILPQNSLKGGQPRGRICDGFTRRRTALLPSVGMEEAVEPGTPRERGHARLRTAKAKAQLAPYDTIPFHCISTTTNLMSSAPSWRRRAWRSLITVA
jgi:hypothetical protein